MFSEMLYHCYTDIPPYSRYLRSLAYGGGGHCAMTTPSNPKNKKM